MNKKMKNPNKKCYNCKSGFKCNKNHIENKIKAGQDWGFKLLNLPKPTITYQCNIKDCYMCKILTNQKKPNLNKLSYEY